MNAKTVATPELVSKLSDEIKENIEKGQNQEIKVVIKDVTIKDETKNRIRVLAKLGYSDVTWNKFGKVVARTNEHTFMRNYNFIWNGRNWVIDK
jgi:predicted lipid-binding transport protein (Tim44 family)